MRIIIVGLLIMMMVSGCTNSGYVGLVKGSKNIAGVSCSKIPGSIYAKMGFKVQSAEWVQEVSDGFTKVALKLQAKKVVKNGPVYMSYNWNPEFRWNVERSSRCVIPANKLAKDWMRGTL
jgi:hypothetical protein